MAWRGQRTRGRRNNKSKNNVTMMSQSNEHTPLRRKTNSTTNNNYLTPRPPNQKRRTATEHVASSPSSSDDENEEVIFMHEVSAKESPQNKHKTKKIRAEKINCTCGQDGVQEVRFDGAFRSGSPSPGAAAAYTCCYQCPFVKYISLPPCSNIKRM